MDPNQNLVTSAANPKLHYTIVCEDVRLEVSHKLSLMGILNAIQVPQLPVTLLKLAVLNHWTGGGQYLTEVRILTPDRSHPVAVSPPSPFEIPVDGHADNVTIFANISFQASGNYVIQTLINSTLFSEYVLAVTEVGSPEPVASTDTVH